MAIEINELKQMLKHSTAVLILDNGDPSFVVLDYSTYRKMISSEENGYGTSPSLPAPSPSGRSQSSSESELIERINKDILALKAQIEEEEKGLESEKLD